MGIILVAVVGVLIAIFMAGNSTPPVTAKNVQDVSTVNSMLSGIPQSGTTLGSSNAPVTLVGYEDLKCPICQQYNLNVMPTLVANYVKTGKVKMVYVPQTFVGQQAAPGDSLHAAQFALAAADQNKFWNFAELFYHNQQDENTTYVTDTFLKDLGAKVPGLNVNQALADRNSSAIAQQISQAASAFSQAGFTGTPSFQVGKTGGQMTTLKWTSLTTDQFTGPLDSLLGQ
ncbi:MAG TPA: thioredoxin domain-containing protein [Puia sp.]|nr:thioredoxin domain-containing protein [Puia sp.]